MRRAHNEDQDVVLFVGSCRIITAIQNRKIGFTPRTVLLHERAILTYKPPEPSGNTLNISQMKKSKPPKPAQQGIDELNQHQFEYQINPLMRPKLLIGRKDSGVEALLQGLGIPPMSKQQLNIVAVCRDEDKIMNGFLFEGETVAQQFYCAFKVAIATQLYWGQLPQGLSFNYSIANLFADAFNGQCIIDPNMFQDGRAQQAEITYLQGLLKSIENEEELVRVGKWIEVKLAFRIVDQISREHAVNFLDCLASRVEKLNIQGCQMNTHSCGNVLLGKGGLANRMIKLQQVNLSHNTLTDDALSCLTALLGASRHLTEFELNYNCFTLQKQPLIIGFFNAVDHFRLNVNLANNNIKNHKLILKYLLAAQGSIPLLSLNLTNNPFEPQDLAIMTKIYLTRVHDEPDFDFRLHIEQMELDQPHAFEFLQEECWSKRPKTMSIPLAVSRHAERRVNKEIAHRDVDSAQIDEMLKAYGCRLMAGDLYSAASLHKQLNQTGLEDQTILSETLRCQLQRKQLQSVLLARWHKVLNFGVPSEDILSCFKQTLRWGRRRGLVGMGTNCLSFIKWRIEQLIDQWKQLGIMGQHYRKWLYGGKERYTHLLKQGLGYSPIPWKEFVKMAHFQLQEAFHHQSFPQETDVAMIWSYLTMASPPSPYPIRLLETCLCNPLLSAVKVLRFDRQNLVIFEERPRVELPKLFESSLSKIDLITRYGMETYSFSQGFIESGMSSSEYPGMLSNTYCPPEQEKVAVAFVEICKRFFTFLYSSGDEGCGEEAAMYLGYITEYLVNLEGDEGDMGSILIEELLVHLMTFYPETQQNSLKKGMLLNVACYMSRRVTISEELLQRLAAHCWRVEGAEQPLPVHSSGAKVDWAVRDLKVLSQLLTSGGRVAVTVGAAQVGTLLRLNVDQLFSVTGLWGEVMERLGEVNKIMHLPEEEAGMWWLWGDRGDGPQLLPSYQQLGRLLFTHGFESHFTLRRAIFSPRQHSQPYLNQLPYDHLLSLYWQIHATLTTNMQLISCMEPEKREYVVATTIWIDVLVQQQLRLSSLKRQEGQQARRQYLTQRQAIVNAKISQLYKKYLPKGMVIDQEGRTRLIAHIQEKQNQSSEDVLAKTRQTILQLLKILGKGAYLLPLPNCSQQRMLWYSNYELRWVDRQSDPVQEIVIPWRNLLWWQLRGQDPPELHLEWIEEVSTKGDGQVTVRKASVAGDHLWISQSYVIVNQIAKIRLQFGEQLLASFEDHEGVGLKEWQGKEWKVDKPVCDMEQYYQFTLDKLHSQKRQQQTKEQKRMEKSKPPSKVAAKAESESEKKVEEPQSTQETVPNLVPPLPANRSHSNSNIGLQAISEENSSSKVAPSERSNIDLEEIIGAAGQRGEEAVRGRRSSGRRGDGARRRSRNRG